MRTWSHAESQRVGQSAQDRRGIGLSDKYRRHYHNRNRAGGWRVVREADDTTIPTALRDLQADYTLGF